MQQSFEIKILELNSNKKFETKLWSGTRIKSQKGSLEVEFKTSILKTKTSVNSEGNGRNRCPCFIEQLILFDDAE